jgi:hypothetical protein
MTESFTISERESRIEEILERAVRLFQRTGLTDLANKWDKILSTYNHKKTTNSKI